MMQLQTDARPSTPLLGRSTGHSRLGVILILSSCCLFSGMYASVRYASERLGLDPNFLAIARGAIQFALLSALLIAYSLRGHFIKFSDGTLLFMFLRGLLGSCAMLAKYEALSRLPVGIAVSLFSTTPLFAAFFAFALVGEVLSNYDIVSMGICLTGAVLVGVSDGQMTLDGHVLGVALAVLSAAITAMVFVTIRAIGTQVHFFFSVQAMSIGAMCTPFLIRVIREGDVGIAWGVVVDNFEKAIATRENSLAVACVGLFSFAAAMCLNRALQLLGAGKAAVIRTVDIPINFVIGFLLMGELPHARGQFVGCILITLGIYISIAGKTKR